MEGGTLLQFNVNEGLSHPAQPTNVLVGKMSSDKISDKSCDSHCVPESKPHRRHKDFFRTLLYTSRVDHDCCAKYIFHTSMETFVYPLLPIPIGDVWQKVVVGAKEGKNKTYE